MAVGGGDPAITGMGTDFGPRCARPRPLLALVIDAGRDELRDWLPEKLLLPEGPDIGVPLWESVSES